MSNPEGTMLTTAQSVFDATDATQDNFCGAEMRVTRDGVYLETYWRSREVYGTWVFSYDVAEPLFHALYWDGFLILSRSLPDEMVFSIQSRPG